MQRESEYSIENEIHEFAEREEEELSEFSRKSPSRIRKKVERLATLLILTTSVGCSFAERFNDNLKKNYRESSPGFAEMLYGEKKEPAADSEILHAIEETKTELQTSKEAEAAFNRLFTDPLSIDSKDVREEEAGNRLLRLEQRELFPKDGKEKLYSEMTVNPDKSFRWDESNINLAVLYDEIRSSDGSRENKLIIDAVKPENKSSERGIRGPLIRGIGISDNRDYALQLATLQAIGKAAIMKNTDINVRNDASGNSTVRIITKGKSEKSGPFSHSYEEVRSFSVEERDVKITEDGKYRAQVDVRTELSD